MKKRSLLLGLIFSFFALTANAQIITVYDVGFETTGENYSYTTTGSAAPVTNIHSSGNRAMKLSFGSSEVVLTTDTIDCTEYGNCHYFFLEFMHICDVNPLTAASASMVAIVEFRTPEGSNSAWQQITGTQYDMTWGGGSSDFQQNSSFSNRSYDLWQGTLLSNSWWKRERFTFSSTLDGMALLSRKIQFRFRLYPKNASASAANTGWYLDGIKFKISPQSMAQPIITMKAYPDLMDYPNSRAARIEAKVVTSAAQGICNDSVYIEYKLGTNVPVERKTMAPVSGVANVYRTYIPFCGYDTIVSWRLVAKDNTNNHNTATFPVDASAWNQFKFVRGYANYQALATAGLSNVNDYPFPSYGDSRSQFIFDSATLADAGYKPGAMTYFQFMAASNCSNSRHERVNIVMRNMETSFAVTSASSNASASFYLDDGKVVYDSALVLTQNNGTMGTINLQDTFFYAGKDILMLYTCNNTNYPDPQALSVKCYNSPSNKQSIYRNYGMGVGFDPFTNSLFNTGTTNGKTPNFSFRQYANLPLLYDCGISGFITPNDTTSANALSSNNVTVTLTNYGATPIHAVKLWYKVDNDPAQYYDWTGTLNANASVNVTINTTQQYSAGYHEMLAWVDDTVTYNNAHFRDHEPLNDTCWTKFVACAGPMSGVRQVGGANADFETLEKCLYALSQCGVNGPLTVKLAPGSYEPHVFPRVPGASYTNYVQLEPLSGTVRFIPPAGSGVSQYLVNLQNSGHIRFKNIDFIGYSASNTYNRNTYLARLGISSSDCHFINCSFREEVGSSTMDNTFTSALLYSGGADSVYVENCTFYRGAIGVSLVGPASDNLAHGSRIYGSTFTSQQNNSVVVRNQTAAVVDSNIMNDVMTNSSYLILLQDCYGGTRVTRNKVYVTTGASCIGATDMAGTASDYAVIANNMLVCADEGNSNMLVTPLNIITADYTKVVFNSVKMTAPARAGIAAATLGGGIINHCYFFNNIVSCFDTANFAFNYIPNAGNTNYIGYNIYYSQGALLNKFNSIGCPTLATWQSHYSDANSQSVNPAFLGADPTDLRSYSQNVKHRAIPIAEVSNDLFGTIRDTASPCVGAFEFSALPYDFEVTAMLEPYDEYCNVPNYAELVVVIKNSGVNDFNPANSNLTLTYSRNNHPGQMTSTNSGNVTVNRVIPGNDTIHFHTNRQVQIPTNGMLDTSYYFSLWLTSTIDPNPANDTSIFTVSSHYHYPAPDSISVTVGYGTTATLNASGMQTWYSNVYTSGRTHNSILYWYDTPYSTTPFFIGNSYTTPTLYTDTLFYIRQRRDYPLVKISEVQIKTANVQGVTYPMPLWMNAQTTFAVELTNIGDAPADMTGDTLLVISNTSSINNKVYVFPSVTIQPHSCLVLQYRAGINNVDSTKTLGTATVSPNANHHFAILYKDGQGIVDGVAFNDFVTSTTSNINTNWVNAHVPNTVWAGAGIPLNANTAGVYRKGWPTNPNATPSNSAGYWQVADSVHIMTLGTINQNLIRFTDNGCEGDYTTARVHLNNLPNVDLALDSLDLPSGCGLALEPVDLTIRNHGAQPSGSFVAYFSVNDTLVCADTIASLGPNSAVLHHFSTPANLYVASGERDFIVKAWVGHISSDNSSFNDTTVFSLHSAYTPAAPNVYPYDTVFYANSAELHAISTPSDSLLWYDKYMNALDTVNNYTTAPLFVNDTFYVTAFGAKEVPYHVGTLANVNNANAYPSPYNPNKNYVKEQYLFTAAQINAAGHSAGPIRSVSFYLDTIFASSGTMTFTNYRVAIGSTSQTTFTANNNWQTTTEVFNAPSFTLTNANRGWVRHTFTTPFIWDGTSSIVVEISRSISTAITQGARTRYTNGGNNTVLYKNDATTTDIANFVGNGSRSANRPDILFGFEDYGCEGPASPVYVTVLGTPALDAALDWPAGSDTMSISSCGSNNFDVAIHNGGLGTIHGYTIDYWIDGSHSVFTSTDSLASQADIVVTIASPSFTPGRHQLRAAITVANDTVPINDTISRMINVSFCAGTYTIGSSASNQFHTFNAAIDTLNNAGIAGPITFLVESGTYNEQLDFGPIEGSSGINTITFRSASGDRNSVILRYAPTNAANYVMNISSCSNLFFERMSIYGAGSQNYSNVITMDNAHNIHFVNDYIHVKGTIKNANASCMIVGENVQFLYIDTCTLDSGYYSVKSNVAIPDTTYGMYFSNSRFTNFYSQGIFMRKVNDIYIKCDTIRSGVNDNARALTGILIAEHKGGVDIERNQVILSDNKNGGKRGIHLVNCIGTNALRGKVYNNMVAINGIGVNGLVPGGIWIDSCEYLNVYYNSVRLYAGANAPTSRAFTTETSTSNVFSLNNIFSNYSNGYAVYVKNPININTSNYNAYYSNGLTKFAYWGVDGLLTFDTLKMVSHLDVNSTNLTPYFASETDLHLAFGVYCEMAQYNTEVPNDNDGDIRPQIPSPCIGADEPARSIHDICVMDVVEPNLASNATEFLSTMIEGDTLFVVVKLYNDGSSVETNTRWKADIFSYPDSLPMTQYPNLTTGYRTIDEHPSHESIFDTFFIVLPVGVYDTNWIRVTYQLASGNDNHPHNDTAWAKFFINDAFNLSANTTTVASGDGCRLHNTQITVTVTNVGRKNIPVSMPLSIGYQAILNTSGVTIAQLPLAHTEACTLPAELEVNASCDLTFQVPANLYPTGTAKDIQVRVRSWCTLQHDHRPQADTTTYVNVTSKYTPSSPVGTDLHIPYATWDTIFATHTDVPPTGADIHRPIRWYRDSLDADPFRTHNNYAPTTWWETPQYFYDSVYFLSCISATGCTSYYSPVWVHLNPRVSVDASLLEIEEPYSKVFMDNDSVKVRIINYGTQPISNIPVVYQFVSNNNVVLQQVREVCHATIQPDDTYLFKFDSLIQTPLPNATYKIRAWTDLSNEQVRLNDTTRTYKIFNTLPESTYCDPTIGNEGGIDITRVSYASLDMQTMEVGTSYYNMASFVNPEVEPLRMIKGTTDTFYIETSNSDDFKDFATESYLTVFIDYNRNGEFEPFEIIYQDTTLCRHTEKFVYTYPNEYYVYDESGVPHNISLGYMRMRVCAIQGGTHAADGCPDNDFGQVQDYLLYIEDVPAEINVSASRIVSPRDHFVTQDSTTVVFMMSNKGSMPITAASIAYAFIDDSCTAVTAQGTMEWTGLLEPGQSVPVSLPTRHLITGTTNVKICINTPGDTIHSDDTLRYQYHRFKTITLVLDDHFERNNIWYAPTGYNEFTKNFWELGVPHKVNIASAHSDSCVWATNLIGLANHGGRGNLSILYTPLIDISQIRPDTIDFWLATAMSEDCYLEVQFWDYLGRWVTLGSGNDTLWYTGSDGFVGASSGYAYEHFRFSTNAPGQDGTATSGDFQQTLQFRLVYHSKRSSTACDGVSLDDFRIGRAQRDVDVGIIQITHPTHPKFGQTIYPKVVIKNYGYDTIYSVNLAYRPYGSNLAKVGTWESSEGLAPGANTLFTFPDPFIVMNTFPDTFQICAYTTVNMDIYWENDSCCKDFYLSPLDNDMGACEFVYPLDHIVAGDSITVTTRIRNYGQAPVSSTDIHYIYNGFYHVTETIDFNQLLGRPLESFEYFNYTFHQKCRASMGVMHLDAYVEMEGDDYLFNDTITKTLQGISAITDLQATAVIVDTSDWHTTYIQLQIDNVGARAANDFQVGFWIDNDTSTLVLDTVHLGMPLAALSTLYYRFEYPLEPRNEGYQFVTGFVHIDGDNDLSNDTTNFIAQQFVDLRAVKVLVEENREETCHVRLQVENLGNMTFNLPLTFQAVINGQTVTKSNYIRQIGPGALYSLDFDATISKSPTRTYQGSGRLMSPSMDHNATNDQTTVVEVVNYFEGIPFAESGDGLSLDQNYPNPYVDETSIGFHLPEAGEVRFFVMDELGRLVYQTVTTYSQGDNSITFKEVLPSTGVYYYGIEFNGEKLMRKMVFKN